MGQEAQARESFWFSDFLYQKLRSAIVEDRVRIAKMNVFDVTQWPLLREQLPRSFPAGAILDVSNVLDYGTSGFGATFADWNKHNPRGRLLFTSGFSRSMRPGADSALNITESPHLSWGYYWLSFENIARSSLSSDSFVLKKLTELASQPATIQASCGKLLSNIVN
jgi:hypothetical protein